MGDPMDSSQMETHNPTQSSGLRSIASMMFAIGLVLWLVTPVFWLYVGSKVKVATDSMTVAVIVMMAGASVTVALLVRWIVALNQTYRQRYHGIHDEEPERTPIEPMMVVGAGLALIAFGIWFMVFAKNPLGANSR